MIEGKLSLLRRLLNKSEKSETDLRLLYELLSITPLKDNLFKLILAMGQSESLVQEICRGFTYKFFAKGDVIFEEGDTDTKYLYFIIKGKVGIFIKSIYQKAMENSKMKRESLLANDKIKIADRDSDKSNMARRNGKLFYVFTPSTSILKKGSSGSRDDVLPDNVPQNGQTNFLHAARRVSNLGQYYVTPPNQFELQPLKAFKDCDVSSKFFNCKNIKSVFFPSTEEESNRLEYFEQCVLKDTTLMDGQQLQSIRALYGEKVRDLESWSFFGELSVEIAKPRTATVVALTNTEMIRIRQTDYQSVIKGALKAKKLSMANFLTKAFHISSHRSECIKLVNQIQPSVKKLKVKKGHRIVCQGQSDQTFFIIKRGEFRINKVIQAEPFDTFYELMEAEDLEAILKSFSGQTVHIGLCGPGEFVGEEAFFDQGFKYEYSIECVSITGTLLTIKSEMLKVFPKYLVNLWKELYASKRNFRIAQFQKVLLFLLKTQKKSSKQFLTTSFFGAVSRHAEAENIGPTLKRPNFYNRRLSVQSQDIKKALLRCQNANDCAKEKDVFEFQRLFTEGNVKEQARDPQYGYPNIRIGRAQTKPLLHLEHKTPQVKDFKTRKLQLYN